MTQCERDYIEDTLIEIAHHVMDSAEENTKIKALKDALIYIEQEIRSFALIVHTNAAPIECKICKHQTVCKGAIPSNSKNGKGWHHVGYRFESKEASA